MLNRESKLNRRFSMGMLAAKKVVNSLTGESQKKAGKQAVSELTKGREAVSGIADQSRTDLFDLFGQAQESRLGGLQGALDVFQGAAPARTEAFQGGNVAAQQQLLAGLPQIQNAILGNEVDLSGLQPTQLPVDLSFLQGSIQQEQPAAVAPPVAPPAAMPQPVQSAGEQQAQVVNDLYREILGRDADPEGLSAKVNEMRKGQSANDIRNILLASPEYRNRQAAAQQTQPRNNNRTASMLAGRNFR
jgi:hypothetical protein